MGKKHVGVQPKNPQHQNIYRGGSASTPGGANYKGSNPRAHNPAKKGASRSR